MIYCAKCHYNLEGLEHNTPCPECGCSERCTHLGPPPDITARRVIISLIVCLNTFFLFAYGAGPPSFAGGGSIQTHNLPNWLNFSTLVIATVSLLLAPYWIIRRHRYKSNPPTSVAIEILYLILGSLVSAHIIVYCWFITYWFLVP